MGGESEVRDSGFPTRHLLRASLRAASVLADRDGTPLAQVANTWIHTPSDGIFSAGDLAEGADILERAGFVRGDADRLVADESIFDLLRLPDAEACEAILAALLTKTTPLWLSAATSSGTVAPEFMPTDVTVTLSEVIPDPERRERLLLQLGEKYNDEERRKIGDIAERCVEAACRDQLAAVGRADLSSQVRRVSLSSDSLGYDITAPRTDGSKRRIESKGTRQSGDIVDVVLSRNEAEVARRDPDWSLVLSRVSLDDHAHVVGWISGTAIQKDLPVDTGGRWMTTQIYLNAAELHPGLPPLDRRPTA